MIKWWRKWGSGGADTEWLRRAGFTRRNTRRAILKFLADGLLAGERILHLTSGIYRLQMGFMAITDRRVVVGMSWAFLPVHQPPARCPARGRSPGSGSTATPGAGAWSSTPG